MKRLIIHLKKVDKVVVEKLDKKTGKTIKIPKIFNTLNIIFENNKQLNAHISRHKDNTKSYKVHAFNI
jgi:hypothetical protein